MEELIEIRLITVNKQPIGEDHIEDFVELLEQGKRVPPIVIRKVPSGYVLVDGRHRLQAHKKLGYTYIKARVTL